MIFIYNFLYVRKKKLRKDKEVRILILKFTLYLKKEKERKNINSTHVLPSIRFNILFQRESICCLCESFYLKRIEHFLTV